MAPRRPCGPRTLTVPVQDTIDAFRIDLESRPRAFQLEQIVLLVRPGDQMRLLKEYEP